jgi:hypothetical protein
MRRLVHLLRPFIDVNGRRWHHPSVSALMHLSQAGECPESVIDRLCCELVAEAKAFGWSGPPFDPEILASLEGISVETVAQEIGADARIFPTEDGHLLIQCISSVSAERRRFSIAHEIVHTRFPDCYERVRYRSEGGQDRAYSELEQLCNAGAAEILMPKEDIMLHLANQDVSAEVAEGLRKQFGVSRPKRALSTNLSLTGSGKTSVSRLTTLLESCPCCSFASGYVVA